jgi:hypothetical protein
MTCHIVEHLLNGVCTEASATDHQVASTEPGLADEVPESKDSLRAPLWDGEGVRQRGRIRFATEPHEITCLGLELKHMVLALS